ncbi:MAG: NAD(P)-dependent glycerol-1-phosphate dehydrogenase, partial [Candidatus Ranarchaeia archaeon]
MSVHIMQLPREVIIGSDILSKTGEVAKRLGLSGRALLVTGPTTLQIAGKQVEKSLSSYGFEVDRLIITQPGVEE